METVQDFEDMLYPFLLKDEMGKDPITRWNPREDMM